MVSIRHVLPHKPNKARWNRTLRWNTASRSPGNRPARTRRTSPAYHQRWLRLRCVNYRSRPDCQKASGGHRARPTARASGWSNRICARPSIPIAATSGSRYSNWRRWGSLNRIPNRGAIVRDLKPIVYNLKNYLVCNIEAVDNVPPGVSRRKISPTKAATTAGRNSMSVSRYLPLARGILLGAALAMTSSAALRRSASSRSPTTSQRTAATESAPKCSARS